MRRNATYYHGDLRRDLLDAALEAIHRDGPHAVSMRGLAKAVGVSHAAHANHFRDKRALFTAIAAEGFVRLGRAFADAVAALPADAPPIRRIGAGGRAYIDFALANPAHFAVMWRSDLLDRDDEALSAAGASTFDWLVEGVRRAQGAGWAAGLDADAVAMTLWSTVHGYAVLRLQGPLPDRLEGREDTLADHVVDLVGRIGVA